MNIMHQDTIAAPTGLSDHNRAALLERVRALSESVLTPNAATWDRERRYCWDNIPHMVEAGVMGMTLPKDLGGLGASYFDVTCVIEEIAKSCTLSARIVVEANMGGVAAIMAYGSHAQKALAAELVLAGDKPAICITEPEAGSAATEMRTTARRVEGGYRLDGVKHWITGGGVSRLHLIFAQVVSATGVQEGIGGFIVVADPARGQLPNGFRVVRHERTMGLCGMPEAELEFRDVFVPDDMVLEPPGGFRRGFARLMNAYNSQRVGAGTVAMGIAAGALDRARQYALDREQFGRPIAEFQGLQWMLADMDVAVEASRLMLHDAARSRGPDASPFPDPAKAARAKLFASEQALKVVSEALQVFGARGYGSEEPVERMYRDVRMFTIGGGTAQILRTQIAGALLGTKTPQTRDGYARLADAARAVREAAE